MSLDPKAVQAADAAFYAKHPERKGKPLQKGEPGFEALAKEWKALYEEAKQDASKPKKTKPTAKPPAKEPQSNVGNENTSEACEDCAKEPQKIKITARASLFFDGTLNNKTNVAAGKQKNWMGFEKSGQGTDTSYDNGLTNIARLEKAWNKYKEEYDVCFRIYVEGPGTLNMASDEAQGYALGAGDTGVIAKVQAGLEALVGTIDSEVKKQSNVEIELEYVKLDVFGFSRGAAVARNFIWACLENKQKDQRLRERLIALGKFASVGDVEFVFVGLYDTVASFAQGWGEALDSEKFDNDTAELHLTAISNAKRVVHLAAADEHRKNFSLTNIKSAGGKGLQIFLPGVHSDVGGSYIEGQPESVQLLDYDVVYMDSDDYARFERERQWFINSGWYSAEEIQPPNFTNELIGNRQNLSEKYSYIPMLLMADYAGGHGLEFKGLDSYDFKCASDDDTKTLAEAKAAISAYITSKAGSPPPGGSGFSSKAEDWFTYPKACGSPAFIKKLRHRFLHISAKYGDKAYANEPNWQGGGTSQRGSKTGIRKRVEHDG